MNLKFLSEESVRQQLTLDDDVFEAQSAIIEDICQAAEDEALNFIGRTIEDLIDKYGCVPKPIHMACLGEIASNFHVREDEEDRSARTLRITNYRRWHGRLIPYRKKL